MIKNIIGASMVSIAYGVACSGVFPSIVVCIAFASLSAYTFGYVGLLCGESGLSSYRDICTTYIHKRCGVSIDFLLAIYTLPACVAYSIFLCDCITKMIVQLAPSTVGDFISSRAFVAILVTVIAIFPLCCIERLGVLSYTSIIGIAAIIYAYVFVCVDLGMNGADAGYIIETNFWFVPSGSFIGLFPIGNIYATCYIIHYNVGKYYTELKDPTKIRFYTLTFLAFGFVAVFCGSFGIMGFARFGINNTPGNILIAYDHAYAVWICMCISVITTYPFVFDAGRRSVISVLDCYKNKNVFWTTTCILVPLFSLMAIYITSIELVIGITGCMFGITLGFTLPGIIMIKKNERIKGISITIFGSVMSILGMVSIFIDVRP